MQLNEKNNGVFELTIAGLKLLLDAYNLIDSEKYRNTDEVYTRAQNGPEGWTLLRLQDNSLCLEVQADQGSLQVEFPLDEHDIQRYKETVQVLYEKARRVYQDEE